MKIEHKAEYRQKRASEYPRIEDQLDALWKALAKDPSLLVPEAKTMLNRVMEVKAKYPKS